MTKKALLILVGVFVGLFVVVKAAEWMNAGEGATEVQDVLAVSADEFDRVRISAGEEVVVLSEVAANQWRLTEPVDYPANATAVDALLGRVKQIKSDNVISTNPDKQATFEVDPAQGREVQLLQGEAVVADFYIGKLATDGNHTYLRLADSEEIHLIRGNLISFFDKSITEWRDKTVYSISQDAVSQVSVERTEGDGWTLINSNGVWSLQNSREALDQDQLRSLLSQLTTVTATGFVDDPATLEGANFAQPLIRLRLSSEQGEVVASMVEVEGSYYLQTEASAQIYRIPAYQVEEINIAPSELPRAEASDDNIQTAP